MDIQIDDLSGIKIAKLLEEHMMDMVRDTPLESIHALDIEGLRQTDITFWSAWEGEDLLGCGALKKLDKHHAELKSMRTATAHLRKGVASKVLQYLIDQARQRGYQHLSLETGAGETFQPARNLYIGFGFNYCEPFADYIEDSNSVFMMKEL